MKPAAAPTATGFSTAQLLIPAAIGAVLWLLVALLLRAMEPLGALRGGGVPILYVILIPATVPLVLVLRRAAGLRREQTAIGVAIATAVASLLDGTALVLMPSLYGADPLGAAAAILWGVGVALILGVMLSRPRA